MANKQVFIRDFFFDPEDVTIKKGETVEWTNEGNQDHTVTAAGLFDEVLKPRSKPFYHKFDEAGTVNYRCRFHLASHQMKGTVTVT
jgi:plastocyanin